MVSYSSMTFKSAIDEVLLRCDQMRIAINLDGQHVRRFLASARREVMSLAVPFKDWAFVKPVAIADGVELPQDFIAPLRVQLKTSLDTNYTEARELDVREWQRLTASVGANTYNQALPSQPAFMLWGASDTDDAAFAAKGVVVYVAPVGVSGYMEYYASYDDSAISDTDTLNVPYEYENLVILSALVRVAMKAGQLDKLGDSYNQYQAGLFRLQRRTIARLQTEGISLESQIGTEPAKVQTVAAGA